MSEDPTADAESTTRNRVYGPEDHLKHLLRVGHGPQSYVIQGFVQEHNLQRLLEELAKTLPPSTNS